jgi:glycosyltransferase involved in cell wall biosynthesis
LPSSDEAIAFLATLENLILQFHPDVVLTYGGDVASVGIRRLAARAGAKVVFWLHNLGYSTQDAFAGCDAVVAPSDFLCDHYRAKAGINCIRIPPVIDETRILAERRERARYVTFLNPVLQKGVTVFARLAESVSKNRPEIPFLIVEGRGRTEELANCGVDLSNVHSIQKMANTSDPRQFYRLSRLLLIPSLCQESFGRVAVEAMINGIPVIASDRGALPQVIGAGGRCLSLPQKLGPASSEAPSAAELEPWITTLLRLWDDPIEYANAARSATEASARWHSAVVVPIWEKFLSELATRK